MTLSNAAEIVFLAAMVPVLLRVNHERNGRPDGRTDSDDGNRGKATFGCVSPNFSQANLFAVISEPLRITGCAMATFHEYELPSWLQDDAFKPYFTRTRNKMALGKPEIL